MGSDFVKEGERAATWLIGYMHTNQPVNIVELQGTVGSAPAIDRQTGFASMLTQFSNYKIIRSQTGDFTRAKGKEVMEAFLNRVLKNGCEAQFTFFSRDKNLYFDAFSG